MLQPLVLSYFEQIDAKLLTTRDSQAPSEKYLKELYLDHFVD